MALVPPSYDPDDSTFPPLIGPPRSIETGQLALTLKWKLNDIQTARFDLDSEVTKAIQSKWQIYQDKLQAWCQEVEGVRSHMESKGGEEAQDAKWLATMLATDANLNDQTHFRSIISTGSNSIRIQLTGTDYGRRESTQPKTSPTPAPEPDAAAAAPPVDVEIPRSFFGTHNRLSLSAAMQQRLWVCWARSGIAFCIACPCECVIAPTLQLDPAALGFGLFPRYFHTDPFDSNFAVDHFRVTHRETFDAGVEEMIYKYGKRVVSDENSILLDQYMISGHNLAVQRWYAQVLSDWERLRTYRPTRIRSQELQTQYLAKVSRQVDAQIASSSYTFQWPQPNPREPGPLMSNSWVVFCTYPSCRSAAFHEHPLEGGRAATHFARHGLAIKEDYEVLDLFGFRGK